MSWLPDWLTGYDAENAAAADNANKQLQAMNAADYGPGGKYYSPENWAAVQTQAESEMSYNPTDQRNEIQKSFSDKLAAQAAAIFGVPAGALGSVLWAILKAIPWWIWLVAAGALFVWLGGLVRLKGVLAKGK